MVQHYVPQFLLKNFIAGKKDHVWVYDKATHKRFKTHVRYARRPWLGRDD